MTLSNWYLPEKEKAEQRRKEIEAEYDYVKLKTGDNFVSVKLDKAPDKIIDQWQKTKYRYITVEGKNWDVTEFIHFDIMEQLNRLPLDASQAIVMIRKVGEGQKTRYEVMKVEA